MPAKSLKQFKLMQAAAHGKATKAGISPAKAREFVAGQSPKGLPKKKAKKG